VEGHPPSVSQFGRTILVIQNANATKFGDVLLGGGRLDAKLDAQQILIQNRARSLVKSIVSPAIPFTSTSSSNRALSEKFFFSGEEAAPCDQSGVRAWVVTPHLLQK
jgi:hypothetical protein